jgi:uncharacterized alkaline shock family protein YloU
MIARGLRPAEPTRRARIPLGPEGPQERSGSREEDVARVPTEPTPGRLLVSRRAIADIVRAAVLGSYGVTGFAGSPIERLLGALGAGQPGLRIDIDPEFAVDLDLTVAYGLPVAEVARQVDSAVRYAIRRGLGREVDRLTVHVGGLRYQPGSVAGPPVPLEPEVSLDELAESGTDVA